MWRSDRLERELRAQRPEPRKEVVRAIERRVGESKRRRPNGSLRLGLAGALTLAMLISIAAFGGLSYAAVGVTNAVSAATHVVAPTHKTTATHRAKARHKTAAAHETTPARPAQTASAAQPLTTAQPLLTAQPLTSAQVQYLVTMCFQKHTIRVSSSAVRVLRALGAKLGACAGQPTPPLAKTVVVCIKGQNVRVRPATATALVRARKAKRGYCKK